MHCCSPQAPADNIIITYPQEIALRMVFLLKKKPSTFILHSSSGREEEQCLGLLLDPDSREVLWDRFSVATLIVPSASVFCPIPPGWALAVAVGFLPLLAIRNGEQRKSDPAAYQSFAWSSVSWEPFIRAAVVYLSPTCLPL